MYQINWEELTPELFLKEYWQKKPLLIKNAIKNFNDPISPDELAGLAMEADVQSRIISQPSKGIWAVEHGPFEDFNQYGEANWTLLVQAANNWSSDIHQLLLPFNFIPHWRLDDVMVSFSTPNGGVGPHLDQYDVFIIQGEGKRHWQVGKPDNSLESLLPHPELKQISTFIPCIDVITEPGDLLYIPPNHPHNGLAIDNSLNYSIGFQSPNSQELWSGFADKLLDEERGISRFSDPQRQTTTNPSQVTQTDIADLKNFMLTQINNTEAFNEFIGCNLTHCHHQLELLQPEVLITPDEFNEILKSPNVNFIPVLGIKALLIEGDKTQLFVCGESFKLCNDTFKLAQILVKKETITATQIKSSISCLKNIQLLTNLFNKGYWYID